MSIMEYLATTRFVGTLSGQVEYIQMCADYAEIENNNFVATDIEKIVVCTGFALPYFSVSIFYY